MQIKKEKNQLSFVFSDKESQFELGYLVIDQLDIPWMLKGKRTLQRGKEKYQISLRGLETLMDSISSLSEKEQLFICYDLIYGIYRIEELGILSKQSLWCKFDHFFWDNKTGMVKYIVLPIENDVQYEDELSWEERLKETFHFLTGKLSFELRGKMIELVDAYLKGSFSTIECLEKIRMLCGDEGATLQGIPQKPKEKILSFAYLGKDASYDYQLEQAEIILGKDQENCDVAFPFSQAMSRMHCKLVRQNQSFFIQDLDSVNHTLVNGVFVPPYELMELEDRDLITMGDIEIRITIEDLY